MFEILFLVVALPSLIGAYCAFANLAMDAPFPIIHERRRPWPNPFR
jgi:hypothetical protein